MSNAPDKKEKSLFVFDIDNTLTDTINIWGEALDKAVNALAKSRGIKRDVLEKSIMDNVPENLKHVPGTAVGKDIAKMIAWTPALQPKNDEEKKRFEKDDARIIHEWKKKKTSAKLYAGVKPMLRKIKASGAKIVMFTDSRESSCVPRMARMGFPLDVVDALYAQPDVGNDGKRVIIPVNGPAKKFKDELGDRLIIQGEKSHKPNPHALQKIMADFDITDPKQVVMVGDNIRSDGGSAVPLGIDFAWQKDGTKASETTRKAYNSFCTDPNYAIMTEQHLKFKNKNNAPTVVLENGIVDMTRYFKPVKPLTRTQQKRTELRKLQNKNNNVKKQMSAVIAQSKKRQH